MIPKKILPILLGEALEAYDFLLYGLLAVYFSKIFFPSDSTNALNFSFTLFAVAYIARPIGSIFWGHIADKYGRKPVLMGTLSLMAVPAVGMAIMPSYETIGLSATLLIVILRFLQGIAFGGETPTVMVSLYETAPVDKKGFYGSFYNPGALVGFLLGIILIICLNLTIGEQAIQRYGWRIMFAFSIIFIVILGYLRSKLVETSTVSNTNFTPVKITLKQDLFVILKIVLFISCGTAMYYNLLFHNYLIINAADFGVKTNFAHGFIVLFTIILLPITGFISDKIDKIKLLTYGYIVIALSAPFLYQMFLSKDFPMMVLGYFVFAILTSIPCALFPSIVVPQASENCRVTTIGIAFGISVISGSFIPVINELLKNMTGNVLSPAFLIVICAVISLITLHTFNKERIK